ncbi:hypothetical protein B0H65DRAFT_429243, partial [Neurospora tetraspora]
TIFKAIFIFNWTIPPFVLLPSVNIIYKYINNFFKDGIIITTFLQSYKDN